MKTSLRNASWEKIMAPMREEEQGLCQTLRRPRFGSSKMRSRRIAHRSAGYNCMCFLFPVELTCGVQCHFQDVKVLYKQLAVSELEQVGVPIGTGLDDILETIRSHWERDVEKNRMEAGALLQIKVRSRTRLLHSALSRRSSSKEEKQETCKGRHAAVSIASDRNVMQIRTITLFT